jgi:hypothetical protein
LNLHPDTISKWLQRPRYTQRPHAPRSSKLDPFKGIKKNHTHSNTSTTAWTRSCATNKLAPSLGAFDRADLLFQVISGRYERGSTIITTNKAYKDWVRIFNNDGALTSAVLDRLLHRSYTILIEGKSYRMKDRID